jgi:AhpC/TSA family
MAMVEKLDLPFPLLSDPRGDLIKSLDLWNGEEGVSEPAVVVLDRAGTVRRLYSGGTDFSDRPPEEVLLELLEEVSASDEEPPGSAEPDIRVSAAEAERETVRPDKPALTLEELEPYYLGTYFATVAMQKKLEGEAREEVDGYQDLVNEYNAAIQETKEQGST